MRRLASALCIAVAVSTAALAVSGCSASTPIAVASAYVPLPTTPGTTVAYLQIRNNGAADELVAVQTSVGGKVYMRAPVIRGTQVMSMRDVKDIPIPPDATVRLNPDSFHLLITGAGPMYNGKAIMLRLTFAHAGTITVIAPVTDPESGGSSYFLN